MSELISVDQLTQALKEIFGKPVVLEGRDFFNEKEAAIYCGVSLSHFQRKVIPHLNVRDFFGKKVYDKKELLALMQHSPLWSSSSTSDRSRARIRPTLEDIEFVDRFMQRQKKIRNKNFKKGP